MTLTPETIKQLEQERKRLEQRISDLNSQIDDVEDSISAIDLLLGTARPESAPARTLKSLLKADKTFRAQVVTTAMYMDRPVRPVEVAEEMLKSGLFEEKSFKSKVATEMFKLAGDKMRILLNDDGIYRMNPELKAKR